MLSYIYTKRVVSRQTGRHAAESPYTAVAAPDQGRALGQGVHVLVQS